MKKARYPALLANNEDEASWPSSGRFWTQPGKVEASYSVCIASASNLTGLVNASVECRRSGL